MYHFMFAPEWDAGCESCSFWAESFDHIPVHLAHRDVSFVAVSRAPLDKLQAYARRFGWTFPWVSSAPSDFNYDFNVSFRPEELKSGKAIYNYEPLEEGETDMPEGERVREGRERRGLPHLLDVRPRDRPAERRLPVPRPRPQGPRRGRARVLDVLAPPAGRI